MNWRILRLRIFLLKIRSSYFLLHQEGGGLKAVEKWHPKCKRAFCCYCCLHSGQNDWKEGKEEPEWADLKLQKTFFFSKVDQTNFLSSLLRVLLLLLLLLSRRWGWNRILSYWQQKVPNKKWTRWRKSDDSKSKSTEMSNESGIAQRKCRSFRSSSPRFESLSSAVSSFAMVESPTYRWIIKSNMWPRQFFDGDGRPLGTYGLGFESQGG